MNAFAALIEELDQSTGTKRKIDLIADHLQQADAHDAAWTVLLLMGERRKRLITGRRLREILQQASAMPDWLFDDCQSHVGDSAETLSLLWPQLRNDIPAQIHNPEVAFWIDQLSSAPRQRPSWHGRSWGQGTVGQASLGRGQVQGTATSFQTSLPPFF